MLSLCERYRNAWEKRGSGEEGGWLGDGAGGWGVTLRVGGGSEAGGTSAQLLN